MKTIQHFRSIVHAVLLVSILLTGSRALALTEKTPVSTLTINNPTLFIPGTSQVTATDNKFTYMNTTASGVSASDFPLFYNKRIVNRIFLSVDKEPITPSVSTTTTPSAYTVTLVVSVKIWKYNTGGTSGSYMQVTTLSNETLTVNYDPAGRYNAQKLVELTGVNAGNQIEVKVVSASMSSTSVPYKITLGTEVEVERYYKYIPTTFSITPAHTYSSTSGLLNVSWTTSPANNLPEEYELEWVYVDNYNDAVSYYDETELYFSNEVFAKNSTRITTQNSYYYIPVVYTHGFIVYRIRPLWRTSFDNYASNVPGVWTSEDPNYADDYSDCVTTCETTPGFTDEQIADCITDNCNKLSLFPNSMYYEITSPHEFKLNWQYSLSFAEQGKSMLSVNYFDGGYKSRQNVVKPIRDNGIITSDYELSTTFSDIIYDYQGRPAITTLPVPTDLQKVQYNRMQSTYLDGSTLKLYNASHFDVNPEDACNPLPKPMSTQSGSSKYYSPDHDFPSGSGVTPHPEEKFIPDARQYPFMQNIYTPDNTGRIIKKGGPGINHAIGSGHETKYFFGKPLQEELDRWFGTEAGDAARYKKNMVIDPNGQISISYLNPAGKVIATNLGGVRPDGMEPLFTPQVYAPLTADLLNKSEKTAREPGSENILQLDRKRRIMSRELLVDTRQKYYFGYELEQERYTTSCGEDPVCYDCVLDVTISLTDECGNEYLSGIGHDGENALTKTTVGQEILDQIIEDPEFIPDVSCEAAHPAPFSLNMAEGGIDIGETWGSNDDGTTLKDLEVGNYSLKKILKVNQQVLDAYTKDYLSKSCLKTLEYFAEIERNRIGELGCEISCEECKEQLGEFDQYDCDNPDHDPTYPCLTPEEYDKLLAECDEFCDKSVKCRSAFENMLSDMNPQGQYGQISRTVELFNGSAVNNIEAEEIKPHLFPLSVFNESNYLPIKTEHYNKGLRPNWRYPYISYKDEFGKDDYITVYRENGVFYPAISDISKAVQNSDGTYRIKPQYLADVTEFLARWKTSWAQSLVYYHPEYGTYELCMEQSLSHDFDEKWLSIKTYNEAVEEFGHTSGIAHFFDPLGTDPSTALDPYFHSDNPRFSEPEYLQMAYNMRHFVYDKQASVWLSMWDVAYKMSVTPNYNTTCFGTPPASFTFNDYYPYHGIPVAFPGSLTTEQYDQVWNNFKSFYHSLKQRMQDKKMVNLAIKEKSSYNGCIGEEQFNVFKHNFIFTPYVTPPSWFSFSPWFYTVWWSHFFNFQQPCNWARYAFYKDKTARFQEATSITKIPGYDLTVCYNQTGEDFYVIDCPEKTERIVNETRNLAALAMYKQCGKCPLANDLELLLNRMVTPVNSQVDLFEDVTLSCNSSTGEGGYPELTGELFKAIAGTSGVYDGLLWDGEAAAYDNTRESDYMTGVFKNVYNAELCSLRLQFPDNTHGTYDFDDILGFYTLKYNPAGTLGTQSNGSFSILAIVKLPGYNTTTGRHLTGEVLMEGITCLDLANCAFDMICKPSKEATDLQNLFNVLVAEKHYNNPFPTSPSLVSSSPISLEPPLRSLPEHLRYRLFELAGSPTGSPGINKSYYWTASVSSTELTATIGDCEITLTLPSSSYSFSQIIGFTNIRPDSNNLPHGFIITARILNPGVDTPLVTLYGYSACFNFGTCNTELPYPYQMGKPEQEDLEYSLRPELFKTIEAFNTKVEGGRVDNTGLITGNFEIALQCSMRLTTPPVPGFTFSMIIGIVDIIPDKDRPGPGNFIAYAKLEGGQIVPLRGYTENCPGTVGPCRYTELVNDGTFMEDTITVQDYPNIDSNAICTAYGKHTLYSTIMSGSCSRIKNITDHTELSGSVLPGDDHFLLIKTSQSGGYSKKKVWSQQISGLAVGKEYTFKMHYMNATAVATTTPDVLWVEFFRPGAAPGSGVAMSRTLTYSPDNNWEEFTYIWKADTQVITINIYNEEFNDSNFLAIDDISMGRNCPCVSVDLVSNGTFGSEDSLTTELNYQPDDNQYLYEGEYTYSTEVPAFTYPHNFTYPMRDHTSPGSSNFVLTKLTPTTVKSVWRQTLPVEAGKEYVFNAWYFCTDYIDNLVRITLKVNNQVVQQLYNGKHIFKWQIIEGRWMAGGNTNAVIEILLENLQTGPSGTPVFVGLDDIGFTRMCQPQFCSPPPQPPLVWVADNPCDSQMTRIIALNAKIKYETYLADLKKEFQDGYIAKCLQSYESFLMKYNDGSNHVTLYYYDQAGNLVRTIPPQGVVPLTDYQVDQVKLDRASGTRSIYTEHTYASTYRYNSLNQMVAQSVPDNEDLNIFNTYNASSGISGSHNVNGMSFVAKYGLVAATDGTFGKLYKTTNSGASWSLINPEIKLNKIIDQHVIDGNNSIAIGNGGRFLVTDDGAQSWKVKTIPTTTTLIKVRFTGSVGSHTIYIYNTAGNIWQSTNMGDTWSPVTVTTPIPSTTSIRLIHFYASGSSGVAITSDGNIYYTSNGGVAWTISAGVKTSASIGFIQKVNNYLMIAAGTNGTLLSSGDQGNTWTQVNTRLNKDIKEVHLSNANEGCMLDWEGNLYNTADGGYTWTQVDLSKNMLNNSGPYVDIDFLNKDEGFAINTAGQLLYTNNGGKGWVNRNNSSALTGVSAMQWINANEAFFVRTGGVFYYTKNGGYSWSAITISGSLPYSLSSVAKVRALHLTHDETSGHFKGLCVDSPDAYYNYVFQLDIDPVALTVTYSDVSIAGLYEFSLGRAVHVYSKNKTYVLTHNYVYETTDGGTTWATVAYYPHSYPDFPRALWMENGSGASKGLIVGDAGSMFTTADKCTTWTDRSKNIKPVRLNAIRATSTSEWYAAGDKGTLLISTDGGLNWNSAHTYRSNDFMDLSVSSYSHIQVAGSKGFIANTTDAGITWNLDTAGMDTNATITRIGINGILTSGSYATAITSSGKLYNWNTTVYPYQWEPVAGFTNAQQLLNVGFAGDNSTWLVSGNGGKIFRTTNITSGTPSWVTATGIKLPPLKDVFMPDPQTAYAVGENGTIVKTTNLGDAVSNWELQTTSVTETLNSVAFIGSKGIAVGHNGMVLKTANGGGSWTVVPLGTTKILNDVTLVNEYFGVIVGNTQAIYMNTSDILSNSQWISTSGPGGATDHLHAAHFVDHQYGIIAGESGVVYKADKTSGGWEWNRLTESVSGDVWPDHLASVLPKLTGVYFRDYNTGYIVGAGGFMMKTVNRGTTFELLNPGTTTNFTAISYVDHKNIFVGGGTTSNCIRRISDEKNLASTLFYYDRMGRLVASQNSRQFNNNPLLYSYTVFDDKARIIEVGEKTASASIETTYDSETGRMDHSLFESWLSAGAAGTKKEVSKTYYDDEKFVIGTFVQDNLRNRVASITYEPVNDNDDDTYENGTHYSYDIHGNVKSIVQEFQNLPVISDDLKLKRIDYEYDLVSGKVNMVSYQKGYPDQFFHKYEYDEENKLTHLFTSTNGSTWEQDARYLYYRHGPLARTELGHDKVQGLDYAYTVQGWLKGVNSNTATASRDIGHDGVMGEATNPNRYFAQDEFGYSLNYYEDDYSAINAPESHNHFLAATPAGSGLASNTTDLYNGNISHMVTAVRRFMQGNSGPQAMIYTYDQLNRISSTNMSNSIDVVNNQWQSGTSTAYNEEFTYDANGNILTLKRKNEQGQLMDNLSYNYLNTGTNYLKNTNKLGAVADAISGGINDIRSGQVFNPSDHDDDNYQYDAIGNLVQDKSEEIAHVAWTMYGKVKSITRTTGSTKPDLEFFYDAAGHRVIKIVKPAGGTSDANWIYTIYVRDAQGNVLSTYERKTEKIVDYASLTYSNVNNALVAQAGAGNFSNFIGQLHQSTPSLLGHMESQLGSNPSVAEDILVNDLSPHQVLENAAELGNTVFIGEDMEQLLYDLDQSNEYELRDALEASCNCQSPWFPKYGMVDHFLSDPYSRKNFLWAGISSYVNGGCSGEQFFNIAAALGYGGGDPYDYVDIHQWVDDYNNFSGVNGISYALNDIRTEFENNACMNGEHYQCDRLKEVLELMRPVITDEPDPSYTRVLATLPQMKAQIEIVALMKEYLNSTGSFLEWMASQTDNKLEYLIRSAYIFDPVLVDQIFNTEFGISPTDENDAVNQIYSSGLTEFDIAQGFRAYGIDDETPEFFYIMQGFYSAFRNEYETIFSTLPNRSTTLNTPEWISAAREALNGMGVCSFYDQFYPYILSVLPYSTSDLWTKMLNFDGGMYTLSWYTSYYRSSNPQAFLVSVVNRQRGWLTAYQQSNNLYGGANGGMNAYFTHIRNYFGEAFYHEFEKKYKDSSNKYIDSLNLREWSLYGSSRIGTFDVSKNIYARTFTGTISSNKLINSGTISTTTASAFNGYDVTSRGDKRFELSNHLGNVLAVVSDKISQQQAQVVVNANYSGYPGGRYQFNTGAGVYQPFYTISTVVGQTYQFDIRLNPNGAAFALIAKNASTNQVLAIQNFSASSSPTDYSFIFKAQSTVSRIELMAVTAATWHIYTGKIQQVFLNTNADANLISENYTSGTGSWSAWSANLTLSNSSGRLKVEATTPTSVEGAITAGFTTVAGKHYRIRAYIEPVGTTANQFLFGHQDAGYSGINSVAYVNGTGWYEVDFTAKGTTCYVITGNYQTSAYSYYIDNLTVEEISADRTRLSAQVLEAHDYYAFGSVMPGREYNQNILLMDNFISGTSGWWPIGATQNATGGTLNISATVFAGRSSARVYNTIPGKEYSYSVTVTLQPGKSIRIYAKKQVSANPADELATMTITSSGRYTLKFFAAGTFTDVYAEHISGAFPNVFSIDDVIVESVEKEGEYRYAFNGKEKDDEVSGSGNSYDFGERSYDPRLGRFKSIDPYAQAFPSYSPYAYAMNNPFYFIDEEGAYPKPSKVLANMGISLPPLAAGIIDGAVDASFLGMAGFVSDMTDAKFRGDLMNAFAAIANDPVGAFGAMVSEYKDVIDRVMAGKATDDDMYFIGEQIGGALAGIITGGGLAKYTKQLIKPTGSKITAKDIFTNSIADRRKAEDFAIGSKKYKGYKNINDKNPNNPTFDLVDATGNVVDITTTNAQKLTPSSFYKKLENLSKLDKSYKNRTLQIYVKKGQYTKEQLNNFEKKLNDYVASERLNVKVAKVEEID